MINNSAIELLEDAAQTLRDRAPQYDKPEGERSMTAAVAAFNAITRRDLTEAEGWVLMQCIKLVRGFTTKMPHPDSIVDGIAYAALMGEARLKE